MLDNKQKVSRTLGLWIILSIILGAVVYPLTFMMPLNKHLWSTSFVFLTIAVSGLSLAFLTFFIDTLSQRWPGGIYQKIVNIISHPFIWLGRNPLAIFILMDGVAIIMIKYIIIDDKSAWYYFYHYAFKSWIKDK